MTRVPKLTWKQYEAEQSLNFASLVLGHKQRGSVHCYSRGTANLAVVPARLGEFEADRSPYKQLTADQQDFTSYAVDAVVSMWHTLRGTAPDAEKALQEAQERALEASGTVDVSSYITDPLSQESVEYQDALETRRKARAAYNKCFDAEASTYSDNLNQIHHIEKCKRMKSEAVGDQVRRRLERPRVCSHVAVQGGLHKGVQNHAESQEETEPANKGR